MRICQSKPEARYLATMQPDGNRYAKVVVSEADEDIYTFWLRTSGDLDDVEAEARAWIGAAKQFECLAYLMPRLARVRREMVDFARELRDNQSTVHDAQKKPCLAATRQG